MYKESLKIFNILVRLRYALLWANARKSVGNTIAFILFFAIGIGAGIFFFLIFSGVGMFAGRVNTASPIKLEELFLVILTQVFFSAVGLCFLLGFGHRDAFSEQSLRRYPLNSVERFIARHLTGLLDPPWTLSGVMVLGLSLGYCLLGPGNILVGLPVALCFIALCYIYVMLGYAFIAELMKKRSTAFITMSLGLILFIAATAMGPHLLITRPGIILDYDKILRFTPAGLSASVITGNNFSEVSMNALLLLAWIVVGIFLLMKIEKRSKRSQSQEQGKIVWNDIYDRAGNLLSLDCGPVASKTLRYHLRCNLMLFSLLTSPLFIPLMKFIHSGNLPVKSPLSLSIGMLTLVAGSAAMAITLNLFCFDDAGIKRYLLWPKSFKDIVSAAVSASVILRLSTVLASLLVWAMLYPNLSSSIKADIMIAGISVATVLIFNSLGIWTSIFFPKPLLFDSMWNNKLSAATTILYTLSILIPFSMFTIMAANKSQAFVLGFWWVSLIAIFLSIGIYLLSLKFAGEFLKSRKEILINAIASSK